MTASRVWMPAVVLSAARREHAGLARFVESQHVVRLGSAVWHFHARRTRRHTGHRQADDVRALYGVVARDQGASKGIVTTTSIFAPGVYEKFKGLIPGRISLRDGVALKQWLHVLNPDARHRGESSAQNN